MRSGATEKEARSAAIMAMQTWEKEYKNMWRRAAGFFRGKSVDFLMKMCKNEEDRVRWFFVHFLLI